MDESMEGLNVTDAELIEQYRDYIHRLESDLEQQVKLYRKEYLRRKVAERLLASNRAQAVREINSREG